MMNSPRQRDKTWRAKPSDISFLFGLNTHVPSLTFHPKIVGVGFLSLATQSVWSWLLHREKKTPPPDSSPWKAPKGTFVQPLTRPKWIRLCLWRKNEGTSQTDQWASLHLPVQGLWVQSLVRELRSHMPCGQRNQNIKQQQYSNNSIKTLKMVYIKKKKIKVLKKILRSPTKEHGRMTISSKETSPLIFPKYKNPVTQGCW